MGRSVLFKGSIVTLAMTAQFLTTACTTQGRVEDLRLKNQIIEKQIPIEVPIKLQSDSVLIEIQKINEQQAVKSETELKESRLLALKTLLDGKDEKLSEAAAKLYMLSFSAQQKESLALSDAERAENLRELLSELKPLMIMSTKPKNTHESKVIPSLMRQAHQKMAVGRSSILELLSESLKLELAQSKGEALNADQATLDVVKLDKNLIQYLVKVRVFDLSATAIEKIKGASKIKKGSKTVRVLNVDKLEGKVKASLMEALTSAEKERLSMTNVGLSAELDKKLIQRVSNITMDGKKLSVAGSDLFANLIVKLEGKK